MRTMELDRSLLVALLGASLMISGCRKYLPFEGENKPPRLVLNGQIQADSVFMIDLAHSLGYIDIGEIDGVENGTVDVFLANGEHIETLSHVGEGHYRGTQVAVAGQAYRVEASAGTYPSIFAVDMVPPVVPIASWDTSSTQNNDGGFGSMNFNVSFRVNDPGGTENYYLLEAFQTRLYDLMVIGIDPGGQEIYDTIYYEEPQRFNLPIVTTDLVLTSEYDTGLGETEVSGIRFLFSDELFNGGQRQFQFRTERHSGSGVLEFQLTSLSADLFKYLRTYERYQSTQGDPFSEPVQVFNNIQGGLGIWGGRSSYGVLIEP